MGFFNGASKVIPEINSVLLGIQNASSAANSVSPNLCKVSKTVLKIPTEEFKDASEALSNINFFVMDIGNFYSSFLNCLNDQTSAVMAGTTIRNIQYLVYQLQTYVIPGSQGISENAEAIGNVFGSDNTDIIKTLADSAKSSYEKMVVNLKQISDDFKEATENGVEITNSNARGYVNTTVLASISSILRDLTLTTTNFNIVVQGFTVVTSQIESVASDMQTSAAATTDTFAAAVRAFSLTINNSKKRFTTRTDVNIMSTVFAFHDFENVLTNTFIEESEMRTQRDLTREYYTNISAALFNDNSYFQKMMLDFDLEFTDLITEARKESDKKIAELTGQVASIAAKSRGSASKCVGKTAQGPAEIAQVMSYFRNASNTCIQNQINVTIQAQTLKTFINEDVVLNFMGAADELCKCVIKGDKNVNERSKTCVQNVS